MNKAELEKRDSDRMESLKAMYPQSQEMFPERQEAQFTLEEIYGLQEKVEKWIPAVVLDVEGVQDYKKRNPWQTERDIFLYIDLYPKMAAQAGLIEE